MSDLEKQLKKLRPKSVPSDLRRVVFAGCEEGTEVHSFRFSGFSFLRALYPGHTFCGSLACIWLIILALHLDTPKSIAPSGPPISWAEWQEAKLERDYLLAQLETPRFEVGLDKGNLSIPREDLKTN